MTKFPCDVDPTDLIEVRWCRDGISIVLWEVDRWGDECLAGEVVLTRENARLLAAALTRLAEVDNADDR